MVLPLPHSGQGRGHRNTQPRLPNAHPRFFGYITAPPAPIGILGDFLAAARQPERRRVAAVAGRDGDRSADRALDRRADRLSGDCGGLLVSGGNMANLVCFFAARAARRRLGRARARASAAAAAARCARTARPRRTPGFRRRPTSPGSAPTRFAGFPTDADQRMDVARARASDRRRIAPPAICRSSSSAPAGSVSTGAVDPLPEHRRALPRAAALVPRRRRLRRLRRGRAGGAGRSARAARWPTRSRSIRTSGSTRRSRPAARSCATPERCGARSPTTRRTTTSTSRRPTSSTSARRTRAASARSRCGWRCGRPARAGYRQMIADDIRLSRAHGRCGRARTRSSSW